MFVSWRGKDFAGNVNKIEMKYETKIKIEFRTSGKQMRV